MPTPGRVRSVPAVVLTAAAVLGMLLLSGCNPRAATRDSAAAKPSPPASTARPRPTGPPPVLTVDGAAGGRVRWDRPLQVSVANARLDSVVLLRDGTAPVPGTVSADGTSWRSATGLIPATRYRLTARYATGAGRPRPSVSAAVSPVAAAGTTPAPAGTTPAPAGTTAAGTAPAGTTPSGPAGGLTVTGRPDAGSAVVDLTTTAPEKTLLVHLFPGDFDVVGAGQPVVVRFNRPVTDRATVERHLLVATSSRLPTAWQWLSDSEVHLRPAAFWPAGEKITLYTRLDRVYVGQGVWGWTNHSIRFSVGDAHVSTVDVVRHTMTVTDNGKVVRILKVSTGRDKYPSVGGVHIVLDKLPYLKMDSATVGIPRDSPDGYYEDVYWDVRISWGGAFVHAAPWSVQDQGVRNVSHGCVNLSPDDAKWFFSFARVGDVVNVVNSTVRPKLSDPGAADWNVPWTQVLAQDPLHGAVAER